MHNQLINIAEV